MVVDSTMGFVQNGNSLWLCVLLMDMRLGKRTSIVRDLQLKYEHRPHTIAFGYAKIHSERKSSAFCRKAANFS